MLRKFNQARPPTSTAAHSVVEGNSRPLRHHWPRTDPCICSGDPSRNPASPETGSRRGAQTLLSDAFAKLMLRSLILKVAWLCGDLSKGVCRST